MDPRLLQKLQAQLRDLERGQVRYRQGLVTATSPLSVALGGSDVSYTDVAALDGGIFAVNDVVAVLTFGNDLLVLGKIGTAEHTRGTSALTFNGSSESQTQIVTHGLGTTPTAIVCMSVAPSYDITDAIVINETAAKTSTTFTVRGRTASGAAIGPGDTPFYWVAYR